MYVKKLYMQTLRLNSDPNCQSPEKGMYFSSPISVFLDFSFGIKSKISNQTPRTPDKEPDA